MSSCLHNGQHFAHAWLMACPPPLTPFIETRSLGDSSFAKLISSPSSFPIWKRAKPSWLYFYCRPASVRRYASVRCVSERLCPCEGGHRWRNVAEARDRRRRPSSARSVAELPHIRTPVNKMGKKRARGLAVRIWTDSARRKLLRAKRRKFSADYCSARKLGQKRFEESLEARQMVH
jgi:hypothetical protein